MSEASLLGRQLPGENPSLGETRRIYTNPPVNEVILDIQFSEAGPKSELDKLRDDLSTRFEEPTPLQTVSIKGTLGLGGPPAMEGSIQPTGWEFRCEEPRLALRVQVGQLTLHVPRDEEVGYVGWEPILEQFLTIHETLASYYGILELRRAGLRYLNKVFLPLGTPPRQWFSFFPEGPKFLENSYAFNLHHTWENVVEHPGLSANVRLAKIDVPGDVAQRHYGALLDIEIFNIWVREAPTYEELPEWFDDAHRVENATFEASITDELRASFSTKGGN